LYAKSSPKDKRGRQEVLAMIERLMPGKSAFFKLEELPGRGRRDSFFLESLGDRILIKGTNALSMASGSLPA